MKTSSLVGREAGNPRARTRIPARWAGAIAVILAASVGVEAAAVEPLTPGDLTAHRGPHTVKADLGSFCVDSEPAPDGTTTRRCADTVPPDAPPRPRLPVHGGNRVHLQLADRSGVRDDPARINASLVRIHDGSLEFRGGPLRERKLRDRTWRVKLPANLRRANAIYVFTRFTGGGDASYTVGLK